MNKRNKMKKDNTDSIDLNDVDISELLDKLLVLQAGNKQPSFLLKTVYIVTSICVIMLVALLCFIVYKNDFSIESILSTLLAFFSIFISIFFYFKADETSTKFYDASYKFMKEISVTLGKIEERFGEKLNNLNDKVSHLDKVSKDASAEIAEKKEFNDIVNGLLGKAKLTEDELKSYQQRIEENEREIDALKRSKYMAQKEADRLRTLIDSTSEEVVFIRNNEKYRHLLIELLRNGKIPDDISIKQHKYLYMYGYVDKEGNINKERIMNSLEKVNS